MFMTLVDGLSFLEAKGFLDNTMWVCQVDLNCFSDVGDNLKNAQAKLVINLGLRYLVKCIRFYFVLQCISYSKHAKSIFGNCF